jgi:hypothetical protein
MQSLTKLEMECPWLAQLKPWNAREIFKDYLVNHYALMAMNVGTIDHARYMTRQLEKEWAGLGILIAKRIKELQNGD